MLATVLLAAALAAAPGRHPLGIDDLLALDRVAAPALSPDGRTVVFTVARAAPAGDRLASSIWLVPAAGGTPRRVTQGDERASGPVFSPDGRRIAFVSDRGGSSQAWVLELDGGEAARVTALPTEVDDVRWAPDGKALLVTSDVAPACGADPVCNEKAQQDAKGRPRLATRLLYRHWTSWRERLRSHVLRVPLDGGPLADLTPGDRDVPPFQRGDASDLAVSPDGKTLYFTAVADAMEAVSTNADVYALALGGGEPRRITSGAGWDGTPLPSPDGKRLAWRSQPRAGYESDRFHLLVAAADGSGPRDLTRDLDLSVEELHWADGGKAIRFSALEAGRTELFQVEVASGKVSRVAAATGLKHLSASRDGRVVAGIVDSMSAPAEIAVLEGGKLRVLTRFGAKVMDEVELGTVQPLEAKGKDGAAIHGYVVLPPGHRPGERHPAVVLVHGGPQGAWSEGWSYRWNPQLYAARGWTVVLPNPRGSTGYGQAYTDAVRDNWGGTPFEDIMALVDAAVASGQADGSRMCAAGASYGGYMVNWINGQTDRFRCLVTHAGDFDVEAAYYDTEELWFPEWEMGRPWERPEAYARWSPHRFVQNWKTPTLVTHGELDYRVTVTQGLSTFTALQRRGIPSKLLVFPDEGHWITKPKNSRVFHDVVLSWLSEHLAAGGPQAAKAP